MAFCGKCGKMIDDSAKFCNYCGAQFENTAEVNENYFVNPEPISEIPVTPAAPAVQPIPEIPVNMKNEVAANKEPGTGAFFGLIVLFGIPVIGLLASILFSFIPKKPALKNFSRAVLICFVINIIFSAICVFAGVMIFESVKYDLLSYINMMTYSTFTSFEEIFSQLGSLDEILSYIG